MAASKRVRNGCESAQIPRVADDIPVGELIELLLEYGIVLFNQPESERKFAEKLKNLGEIKLITPVRIIPKNDAPTLYSHRRMRLHTDTAAAEFVAWHCVRQGSPGEDTLVVDTAPLLKLYHEKLLDELENIHCEIPDRNNAPTKLHLAYEDFPIVRRIGDKLAVNYTPYLNFLTSTEEQQLALQRFLADIEELECRAVTHVHLSAGQSLILDNQRFLHCRTDLDPKSQRCHYRYLVSR